MAHPPITQVTRYGRDSRRSRLVEQVRGIIHRMGLFINLSKFVEFVENNSIMINAVEQKFAQTKGMDEKKAHETIQFALSEGKYIRKPENSDSYEVFSHGYLIRRRLGPIRYGAMIEALRFDAPVAIILSVIAIIISAFALLR